MAHTLQSREDFESLTLSQSEQTSNWSRNAFDGKLTSRILTACIVPVSLVIVMVEVYKANQIGARSTLISLILMELISIIAISCLADKYNLISQKESERISLSHKPKIIFMWLFGIFLLFWCGLTLVINIDDILKDKGKRAAPMDCAFNIIELIAFCSQLYFVTRFSNHCFRSCILVNLGMSFMLSSHFMCWFDILVYSYHRLIKRFMNFTGNELITNTFQNHSNTSCTLKSFKESVHPFIYPTKTEYNLLVAGFLLHIWNSSETFRNYSQQLSVRSKEEHAETEISLSEESVSNAACHVDNDQRTTSLTDVKLPAKTDERTPLLLSSWPGYSPRNRTFMRARSLNNDLLNFSTTESDEVSSESDTFTILRVGQHTRRNWTYVMLVGGLLLMLPFIVISLILITEETRSNKLKFVYEIFCAIYNVVNLLLIVLALYKIYRHCKEKSPCARRFREQQYILAISTAGAITFSAFCLMSGLLSKTKSDQFQIQTANAIGFSNTVNILVIFLQTILIIHSGLVVLVKPCNALPNIFVLLGIFNFVVWFTDSFFVVPLDDEGSSTWIQTEFYGLYWTVVKETVFPFSIFYRFHCCIEMYERYRYFEKQQ